MTPTLAYIDLEVDPKTGKLLDFGAFVTDQDAYHGPSVKDFLSAIAGADFVVGHNLIAHDLVHLRQALQRDLSELTQNAIDTLYWSALLLTDRAHHHLGKDDKLNEESFNNPLNDALKSRDRLEEAISAFEALPPPLKAIYYELLSDVEGFGAFFRLVDYGGAGLANVDHAIRTFFPAAFCLHAAIEAWSASHPVELAYTLSLLYAMQNVQQESERSASPTAPTTSTTTPVLAEWIYYQFPEVGNVLEALLNTPCHDPACAYCAQHLDIHRALKRFFGYDEFRSYGDEPLQEKATQAAVNGESLVALFPTGGGKSLTFQLPALMAGENVQGLTVVISPLLSLMKDQVDNLTARGIQRAVSINGLLSPVERKAAIEFVETGGASLLYISPELLRSGLIERLLLGRNVVRFVIDEAHCFSAWGQDFRVDYLYIGPFIKRYQELKGLGYTIPVSCFTATAKQKVVTDICQYFKVHLGIEMKTFSTEATRENLHYTVLYVEPTLKYQRLRDLIEAHPVPTIVYVSRTKRVDELVEKLRKDGYNAAGFHGKMAVPDKVDNQSDFINDRAQIMVATSAFGMGVDKSNVGLVVHYEISSSLEDYIQESGRAGRDPSLEAACYVLFNEEDLNQHFSLLIQSKLSLNEIQQVWRAVQELSRHRPTIQCSALEIARHAGWVDSQPDQETRVKNALAALETAGYLKRGQNVPHVYATSITVNNANEARELIERSQLFDEQTKVHAARILSSLLSARSRKTTAEAESRVDHLADILALPKETIVSTIGLMRQAHVLSDDNDMRFEFKPEDTLQKKLSRLKRFQKMETLFWDMVSEERRHYQVKEFTSAAEERGILTTPKEWMSLTSFLELKGYLTRRATGTKDHFELRITLSPDGRIARMQKRYDVAQYVLEALFRKWAEAPTNEKGEAVTGIDFSLLKLLEGFTQTDQGLMGAGEATQADVEEALLYLKKMDMIQLEGGFLVLYFGMKIERLNHGKRSKYKAADYALLDAFYKQKIQQIHIVGAYANLMVKNMGAALDFVHDYFHEDYQVFIAKYFKGAQQALDRPVTTGLFEKIVGTLSDKQRAILSDDTSRTIVVAAGPGSGKTKLLVHKLASLLTLEDVKHENLLMLTFSRAAAQEFQDRLTTLIGPSARFVEMKTFHSYAFDLLGKIGGLEEANTIFEKVLRAIEHNAIEPNRITKQVIVIDEAQDMSAEEFAFVKAIRAQNPTCRLIAVGDDDQSIFEFRQSDARFFAQLRDEEGAAFYEMTENYRSERAIVDFANAFVTRITERLKTEPIVAHKPELGEVVVTQHTATQFDDAIVADIAQRRGEARVAILTQTNDDALRLCNRLRNESIPAQLIQSGSGFKPKHLAEIQFFRDAVLARAINARLTPEGWGEALEAFAERFRTSSRYAACLAYFKRCEATLFPAMPYVSDFEYFIEETQFEDLFVEAGDTPQGKSVIVSTIHKAKGREFDHVYLVLAHPFKRDDPTLRTLYVAMTRAKAGLYVHTNSPVFKQITTAGVTHHVDTTRYAEPTEEMVGLGLSGVVLSSFERYSELIAQHVSGDPITIENGRELWLTTGGRSQRIGYLANETQKLLSQKRDRGYRIESAVIDYIVWWHDKEHPEKGASRIVLPLITLTRDAVTSDGAGEGSAKPSAPQSYWDSDFSGDDSFTPMVGERHILPD